MRINMYIFSYFLSHTVSVTIDLPMTVSKWIDQFVIHFLNDTKAASPNIHHTCML